MKKYSVLLLIFGLLLISVPPVHPQDNGNCPDALPPRLTVGERGRVLPGVGNNVRAQPSTQSNVLGLIPGGGFFRILDGPTCANNMAWWQVESGDLIGWTAEGQNEYWLEPLLRITSENAAQVQQVATLGLDGSLLGWLPDGKTLAIRTGGGVKLVDYEHFGALPIREFDTDRSIGTTALSPDSSLLATAHRFYVPDTFPQTPTSQDHTIRLWDVNTGELVHVLEGHTDKVSKLVFSHDNQLLLSWGYHDPNEAHLWDTTTGEELPLPEGYKQVIDFDLAGRVYVLDEEGFIWLWNARIGQFVWDYALFGPAVYDRFVISPDKATLINYSYRGGIQIWSISDLSLLQHFDTDYFLAVDWNIGRIAVKEYSIYDQLTLRSLYTGGKIAFLSFNEGERPLLIGDIDEIAFSSDGRLMAARDIIDMGGGLVAIWDIDTQEALFGTSIGSGGALLFLSNSHDLMFSSRSKGIQLWDAETGEAHSLTGHVRIFDRVMFSPDGRLILATDPYDDTNMHVWDATNWTELGSIVSYSDAVALTTDMVAYASNEADNTIRLWNPRTNQEIRSLPTEAEIIAAMSFNTDGTVLGAMTTGGNPQYWFWDVTTGMPISEPNQDVRKVLDQQHFPWEGNSAIPISPDGLLTVSMCDGVLCLIDTSSQETVRMLEAVPGESISANFSPDGSLLAATANINSYSYYSEGQLYIWDVATGKLLAAPEGHVGSAWDVAFSPDGTLIVSTGGGCMSCEWPSGWDSAVRVWAVQ